MRHKTYLSVLIGALALLTPFRAHSLRQSSTDLSQQLQGSWESQGGGLAFILKDKGEQSLIRIQDDGTVTNYPIQWSADKKFIHFQYTDEPYQSTIDPYYEVFWRPEKPRSPDPLAYKLNRAKNQITIGRDLHLKRYQER